MIRKKIVQFINAFPDWPIERQSPRFSGVWGEYKFIRNEVKFCDYLVVFDGLNFPVSSNVRFGKSILITAEPPSIKTYHRDFLNQFDYVISCHSDIRHKGLIITQQSLPWQIGAEFSESRKKYTNFTRNYDELAKEHAIKKNKNISIITSNKTITKGHRIRLEFARRLKKYFNNDIDVYGGGINFIADKWDAIAPYRYHISIENCKIDDYWTEKLSDAFLGESYPIYYGCRNIFSYFNSLSLSIIDINNFDSSVLIIKKILDDKLYEKNYGHVLESKKMILNKYNLYSFIADFLEWIPVGNQKKVTIYPEKNFGFGTNRINTIINNMYLKYTK